MAGRDMAVVGLTGGIGSGKSTVAARMAERGATVIDADRVAREVVAPGEPALAAIAGAFGPGVLREDGALDRAALAAIVFADAERLQLLNDLLHPRIMARVGQQLVVLRRAGVPWVVYEAALILENRLAPGLSALVAVVSDPEEQLQRLVEHRGMDPEDARRRIAAQTDNATRRAAADLLVDNDGSLDALRAAADAVIDELERRFGALPPAP